ncbi:hypothetical protein IJG66_02290, partial [Candidatus Saccharibacteria bacterium]|nr:hypothetical protein [Candidatus Saccharibacteria bacterium]
MDNSGQMTNPTVADMAAAVAQGQSPADVANSFGMTGAEGTADDTTLTGGAMNASDALGVGMMGAVDAGNTMSSTLGFEEVPEGAGIVDEKDALPADAPADDTIDAKSLKIEHLLEECIRAKASDLHLQVGLPPILRVDGGLRKMPNMPVITEEVVERLIFSTMDSVQQQTLMKDKEFDYSFAFGALGRFRVNAFQERGNLAAAFRLIPDKILSVAELGLPSVV